MRKLAKALLLVVVALIGSVGLAIVSAFTAAFAFGAVALIVPGTGTHNIGSIPEYKQNAVNRYINPLGDPVCTRSDGSCQVGVDYPATFFPLVIFSGWCPSLSCDTWNKSVGIGVTNLNDDLTTALGDPANDGQNFVIFGYSQGGAVVSQELVKLNNDKTLSQADKDRISAVTIGNINNPLGLWSRLSFLPTIPLLDISFGPQLPTKGIKSTNYSFEYDPVGDAPQYWGNPLAMLNALAAFEYVHGYYLSPNENGDDPMPYGYNDATLAYAIDNTKPRTFQDATFVLIPQQGALPLFQPFVDLATSTGTRALIDPVISLIQPVTKVLINLGYDRVSNPGIARTLSILPFNPFQDWGKVGAELVGGVIEGVTNVVNGVDVTKPPTVPPADPGTSSTESNLVSKQTSSTVAKDAVANLKDAVANLKDPVVKVKEPVAKVDDSVAKLKAAVAKDKNAAADVANKATDPAPANANKVKAAVDKVKAAVDKATASKTKATAPKANVSAPKHRAVGASKKKAA
jgi:PE-PPE domain